MRNISLFLFWGDGSGGEANNIYVGVNEEGKKGDVLFIPDKAIAEKKRKNSIILYKKNL